MKITVAQERTYRIVASETEMAFLRSLIGNLTRHQVTQIAPEIKDTDLLSIWYNAVNDAMGDDE